MRIVGARYLLGEGQLKIQLPICFIFSVLGVGFMSALWIQPSPRFHPNTYFAPTRRTDSTQYSTAYDAQVWAAVRGMGVRDTYNPFFLWRTHETQRLTEDIQKTLLKESLLYLRSMKGA